MRSTPIPRRPGLRQCRNRIAQVIAVVATAILNGPHAGIREAIMPHSASRSRPGLKRQTANHWKNSGPSRTDTENARISERTLNAAVLFHRFGLHPVRRLGKRVRGDHAVNARRVAVCAIGAGKVVFMKGLRGGGHGVLFRLQNAMTNWLFGDAPA